MTAPFPTTTVAGPAPRWASNSTAVPAPPVPPKPPVPVSATVEITAAPPAPPEVAEAPALPSEYEPAVYNRPAHARPPVPRPPALPITSDDGRLTLTDTQLVVRGQTHLLLELERVDVQPVKWVLYYLLGGIGLSFSIIAYLQNWLRTMPFAALLFGTSLLLLLGWRGTNRLRLHRLGRAPVNIALPGPAAAWQRLAAETNRRIGRAHDQAAAEAAALLAAADEATRQAAALAQQRDTGSDGPAQPA